MNNFVINKYFNGNNVRTIAMGNQDDMIRELKASFASWQFFGAQWINGTCFQVPASGEFNTITFKLIQID